MEKRLTGKSRPPQRRLKQTEQGLHRIIQGFPIPTLMIDTDHRVIHWNKALETLRRIRAEEVVSSFFQLFENSEHRGRDRFTSAERAAAGSIQTSTFLERKTAFLTAGRL